MTEIGYLNFKAGVENLMAWKEHHALVCQLVSLVNKSFGLILVIAFSHGFVTFITNFYRFISSAFLSSDTGSLKSYLPFLLILLHQAAVLSIFIVTSHRLQSYVKNSSIVYVNLSDYIIYTKIL